MGIMGGRVPIDVDSSDGEEITVAQFRQPPKHVQRDVLKETNVAQAQNRRQRTLDCVYIPSSGQPLTVLSTKHSQLQRAQNRFTRPDQQNSRRASSIALAGSPDAMAHRPRRSLVARSYAEQDLLDQQMLDMSDSEDELVLPTRPTSTRKRKRDVDSDFDGGAESDVRESEEDLAEPSDEQENTSETEQSFDEGYTSAPKKRSKSSEAKKSSAPAKASGARNKTGKGQSSGMACAAMRKLLQRGRDEPKGLDLRLPPMADIKSIFMDITRKGIDNNLLDALKHIGARPLRAATMCSGTEAPLLALDMFRDCLRELGVANLEVDHLFSAEIVPYKQAYIERNFHPPLIFRDITEMIEAAGTARPQATTAWGAKHDIPMRLDILIAGTSCVDFSRLNKHRKVLDREDGGESSKTWFAVLEYSEKFRPAIVLLENVLHGPWDEMTEHYQKIGYEVAGALVDTKNHYLPQTRQRGYLVCFDKSKAKAGELDDAGAKWQSLMSEFRHNASSPVTDFLLSSDVVRAKEQSTMDDTTKEYDWRACEIRHLQYRKQLGLGSLRPFTNWLEGGAINVPEQGSQDWWRKQVERVRDAYEIAILRKAGEYDARYKTRIVDLSQNVDMQKDTTQFGVTPCLTPSGIFFDTYSGRALAPEELMRLQGLPLDKISFTTETRSELQDLAGNAMSTPVVGSAILAAIISGCKIFPQAGQPDPVATSTPTGRAPATATIAHAITETIDMQSSSSDVELSTLLEAAVSSARHCVCEVSTRMAKDPLQRCTECGHTSCTSCGGNPAHSYRPLRFMREGAASVEQKLRSALPLQLILDTPGDRSSLSPELDDIFCEATRDTFSFSHVARDRHWTAVYTAPAARLDLVMNDGQAEWRLFALADETLPADAELRTNLEQPIAKCGVKSRLLDGEWLCRTLFPQTQGIKVQGAGNLKPSWRSKIGRDDYQNEHVWDRLEITVMDRFEATLASEISGIYEALPACATAYDSLYKRVDASGGKATYLLHDPTKTGDPNLDCFVFSPEHEKLEYGKTRPIIASLAPDWKPWASDKDFSSPQLAGASWQPVNIHLAEIVPDLKMQRPQQLGMSKTQLNCANAELIASCTLTNMTHASTTAVDLFRDYAYALEAMRRQLPSEQWRELDHRLTAKSCSGVPCAPPKPKLRWMWSSDFGAIKPYEEVVSAGVYERAMKDRLEPVVLQAEHGKLNFGVNLASLAHRAVAQLPVQHITKVAWILQQNSTSTKHKSYKLRQTDGAPFDQDLGLEFQLFPKQRLVLGWMMKQEAGSGQRFMIEEADEAVVPSLGWRVEVRAEAPVHIRGGICADHPGFGKTITSLALIHSGLQISDDVIMKDLRSRQLTESTASDLLPTKATLIVAPHTLVKQWVSEIGDKLGRKDDVFLIGAVRDLEKFKIRDFERASIIVVSMKVLGSELYADRLAAFTALPGPATQHGRAFTQWHEHARKQLPEHMKVLQTEGVAGLRKHVTEKFATLQDSEELRAVVPSRRLVGSQFTANAKGKGKKPAKEKTNKSSLATEHLNHPLFEMYYFNRVIVDEFQLATPRENASIKAIRADKRWGLSATPALRDSFDVAYLAGLLDIPLRVGSASTRFLTAVNIKNHHRDMTDFEKFNAAREIPSDSLHARIHEHGQEFLDKFCRQNVQDFDIPFQEHLVPVTLDQSHQAEYAELFSHLSSQDMTITKAKASSATARDVRFNKAVGDLKVAEEVMSRAAAYHDGRTISQLVESCSDEVDRTLRHLRTAAIDAKCQPNAALDDMESTLLGEGLLGDADAISEVQKILQSVPSKGKVAAPKKKKAKIQQVSDEDGEEATEDAASKTTKKDRNLTAEVNMLAKCLRTSIREARYFKNIRFLQEVLTSAKRWQCDGKRCHNDGCYKAAVSPVCGHLMCQDCHEDGETGSKCPAAGCDALLDDHHLQWWDKHALAGKPSKFGAKIEKALSIIETIQEKGEKAILFVQYADQLDQVGVALRERGIPATLLTANDTVSARIDKFNSNDDAVVVINASDETAAGLNLQVANHVIFLSPLLRQQQYEYDATMAQAIGRVRRHGQMKKVHVHRIFALRTIDVDILEHRERRTSALTQQGAPTVNPHPSIEMLNQHDEPKAERMQLVKHEETEMFSLQPRSWLVRCDTDYSSVEVWDRVAGFEDYSSRVQWTKKFLEDDAV